VESTLGSAPPGQLGGPALAALTLFGLFGFAALAVGLRLAGKAALTKLSSYGVPLGASPL
jgi:hypothetical protein